MCERATAGAGGDGGGGDVHKEEVEENTPTKRTSSKFGFGIRRSRHGTR